LNPKRRGGENVDFPGLNFLKIARGNFRAFRQFILRHFLAHPLPAHIRAKDVDSLPFFLGNGHDILHRFLMLEMNDTYIVKRFWIQLAGHDDILRKLHFGNCSGVIVFWKSRCIEPHHNLQT